MAVHGRLGRPKYKCNTCQPVYDYHARRSMRCGWVRAADWHEQQQAGWGYIGGAPIRQPETCPGYTSQLPAVLELAELWAWWDKSQLGNRADVDDEVADLISTFNGEIVASRAYFMDESKPKR